MSWSNSAEMTARLVGKTVARIEGLYVGSESVGFYCSDGSRIAMDHRQECCESVQVEDICGDVADLIGSPIVISEETSNNDRVEGRPEPGESYTWTFYRFATVKGTVTVRWLGESNGYYSESVWVEWYEGEAQS